MPKRRMLTGALALCALATAAYAAGKLWTIQVQTARVRSEPNYFTGKELARLAYGARVEVLEEQGTWVRVAFGEGQSGWVSRASLTEKAIVFQEGGRDAKVKADQEELALAGRGFSQDVEDAYRKENRALDYRWVDAMETDPRFRVAPEEMTRFLREGGLLPAEGGAQ